MNVLPEGSTCRGDEHMCAALLSQSLYIGTVIDERRHHMVSSAMPGEHIEKEDNYESKN